MIWRLVFLLLMVAACATTAPVEDFGVLITPAKGYYVYPDAYRVQLGIAARRKVDASAKSAPGYTIEQDKAFYMEAARRIAEAELAKRGLCTSGVMIASPVSADNRTRTPALVVLCKTMN